jgi:hypothetical protein
LEELMMRQSTRLALEALEDRSVPSVTLNVTVENLADADGLFFSPLWTAVHNGRFDIGSVGKRAERFPGLEMLAEEGNTSVISDYFRSVSDGTDVTILAPGGFPGLPVFDPSEVVTETIEVENPQRDQFFSFASMVVPSNDAFIANLNPRQHRLFNRSGAFRGPVTIELYGRDIWDAGTEVNYPEGGGAAFSTTGKDPMAPMEMDENGRIHHHRGLDDFVGTGLPTGNELGTAFDTRTPVARITIDLADGDREGPTAELLSDVAESGAATLAVQVLFRDPSGVDPSSIDPSDLFVLGFTRSGMQSLAPVSVSVEPGEEPGSVLATYQIPAPGGSLGSEDSGHYVVFLNPGAVEDTLGNDSAFQFLDVFGVNL